MKTYCFILHYEGLLTLAAVKQSRDDNVMIVFSAFINFLMKFSALYIIVSGLAIEV